MKKYVFFIIVITAIIILILLAFFVIGNEQKISLWQKLKFLPDSDVEMFYFDNNYNSNGGCRIALRVSEEDYEKLKKNMEKTGYYSIMEDEFYDSFLQFEHDWVPIQRVIAGYCHDTVEYNIFLTGKRVHIYSYITTAEDGSIEIYFSRN